MTPVMFALSCLASERPLPDPEPVRQRAAAATRLETVFNAGIANPEGGPLDYAEFKNGDWSLASRRFLGNFVRTQDNCFRLFLAGNEICDFMWWGSYKNDYGYPFKEIPGENSTLTYDEEKKTITYTKPYLTDGTKRQFTWTLSKLSSGEVKIEWDNGFKDGEEMPKEFAAAQLWITFNHYNNFKGAVAINGQPFKGADEKALIEAGGNGIATRFSGDIAFIPSGAGIEGAVLIKGNEVAGTANDSVFVRPKDNEKEHKLTLRIDPSRKTKQHVLIDFGSQVSEGPGKPHPKIGGVDFWEADALDVPVKPTRNLMINPGFEEGVRGWGWAGGGAGFTSDQSENRFEIVPGGISGNALALNANIQKGSSLLESFAYSLEPGQTYTISFYAKAKEASGLRLAISSVAPDGKFQHKRWKTVFGDSDSPESYLKVGTEWSRCSRTFTADAAGVNFIISDFNSDILLDNFQLEKGATPSDYVSAPVHGRLVTSNADNYLVKGVPISGEFWLTGKPGETGKLSLNARDFYREIIFSQTFDIKLDADGKQRINIPFDASVLDEGMFILKADYIIRGATPYSEYYRMAIINPLKNEHETRNLFSNNGIYGQISRGDTCIRRYIDCGFGSTTWLQAAQFNLPQATIVRKYGIKNWVTVLYGWNGDAPGFKEITSGQKDVVTPEMVKAIEENACNLAKNAPVDFATYWCFSNEEESTPLIAKKKFDEYFKVQKAVADGVRKANTSFKVLPTCGTSGYSRLRGFDAMEGYLKESVQNGFKYDAVAVHPYWDIDKGTLSQFDLDEDTALLIEQMKRYGYGKETPILFPECFNVPSVRIPEWNILNWQDFVSVMSSPSYDAGNREFIQAASAARLWLICLKYWPQVACANIWYGNIFVDLTLMPKFLAKIPNTLGHLMPWVEFSADVRPVNGVRGYVYKLKDGSAIAAIWCIDSAVEDGFKRGPSINVKFDQPTEFYDLMGVRRSAKTDSDGNVRIPLTPAPLFVKARNADLLTQALQNAETNEASLALDVSMQPSLEGSIIAKVKNMTSHDQSGELTVNESVSKYKLAPNADSEFPIPDSNAGNDPGRIFKWRADWNLLPGKGASVSRKWSMAYFYAQQVNGMPDWDKIPAIPMANKVVYGNQSIPFDPDSSKYKAAIKSWKNSPFQANYKIAWDDENLYVRVEANDGKFVLQPESWWKNPQSAASLYEQDGSLELYLDCGANGRTNLARGYDNDDYRYDFSCPADGRSGAGRVWRLREVNWQFAGGVKMPTKEEAKTGIKCDFQRTEQGYVYTIVIAQKYIEPLTLREGFIAGFSLCLRDKSHPDKDITRCLSTADQTGSPCDYMPHVWPLMILK